MGERIFVITIYIYLLLCYKMDFDKKLEQLYLKKVQYEHHIRNYERSMKSDIIPYGLRINKIKPQIDSTSPKFKEKWNNTLRETEKQLVRLLYDESSEILQSIKQKEVEIMENIVDRKAGEKVLKEIEQRNRYVLKKLNGTHERKWNKFEGQTPNRRSFRRTYLAPRSPTVADFVVEALNKSKNVTDNRLRRKKIKQKNQAKPIDEHEEDFGFNLSSGDLSLIQVLNDLQKDDIPPRSPPTIPSTTERRPDQEQKRTNLKEVKTLENGRLKGYFCSDVVFNLSNKVLTDTEISVLNKGLGFSPTPFSINEHKLRNDFNEFCRRIRCKWYFRGAEVTENFSEIPSFRTKSTWNPPKGSASLEVFLGRVEDELFSIQPRQSRNLNLTKEEWLAVKSLKEDRSIIIKPADKGSCVVVWDKQDYIREVEKQLADEKVYEETQINNKDLSGLMNASNNLFKKLRNKNVISEKELKYFLYDYKNAANLGKLYLLPKIHKRLEDVPGRPVISNCGAPTEKSRDF